MATALTTPQFTNEDDARAYLEGIRWPSGPVCPHCGSCEGAYRLEGKAHRKGLLKCADCREQFSVTVGTVFERSKIALSKWILAVHLMCSSKKGVSSHQIHRTLGITYKTAWFMTHRIRLAMTSEGGLMGSGGGTVEADETYIGNKKGGRKRAGHGHKHTVFALVERDTGQVRSTHVFGPGKTTDGIKAALTKDLSTDANVMTDNARWYRNIMKPYASHNVVDHSKGEYVRGDVHTNTIEGVFSVFKRGMIGTYQHCGEQHLQRYLIEFDFRYNNRAKLECDDNERTRRALKGIEGKRLTYKQAD